MHADRRWLTVAALFGALAVMMGAFGAHGLAAVFAEVPERRGFYETAAHYHLVHALAIAVAALARTRIAAICFAAGVTIFSGTLYAMGIGAPRILGAVTPIGGVLLIAGWIALAVAAMKRPV